LQDTLSNNVLKAINFCQNEINFEKNKDLLCLTKSQLVKAFGRLRIPSHETEAFFDQHEIGHRFYYREVLLEKFGQSIGKRNIPGFKT
jgi:hypothetical protein